MFIPFVSLYLKNRIAGVVAAGTGTPNKTKTGSIPSKSGGAP
tara:strand:- start:73 stop:198 length:126 start_codon:yes stop_codon:yes gene_type:complete